jgi:putative oxidoreductase
MNLATISRYLLGLIFFVFGLNGFLQFMPMPELPEKAGMFMGALAETGYFFPVLKGVEVIAGLFLLLNKYVRLMLVILSPIVLHIFLFHLILTPGIQNVVLPIIIIALELIVVKEHMAKFKAVFLED